MNPFRENRRIGTRYEQINLRVRYTIHRVETHRSLLRERQERLVWVHLRTRSLSPTSENQGNLSVASQIIVTHTIGVDTSNVRRSDPTGDEIILAGALDLSTRPKATAVRTITALGIAERQPERWYAIKWEKARRLLEPERASTGTARVLCPRSSDLRHRLIPLHPRRAGERRGLMRQTLGA